MVAGARSPKRFTFSVAALIGLVAVAALVLRGCLVDHGRYTIRLANATAAPLEDVAVIRGERRHGFAPVPPGGSIETIIRFPDPARDSLTFREAGGGPPTTIRLDPLKFGIGPRRGTFEVRVTPSGLRMTLTGEVGLLP